MDRLAVGELVLLPGASSGLSFGRRLLARVFLFSTSLWESCMLQEQKFLKKTTVPGCQLGEKLILGVGCVAFSVPSEMFLQVFQGKRKTE